MQSHAPDFTYDFRGRGRPLHAGRLGILPHPPDKTQNLGYSQLVSRKGVLFLFLCYPF
jgi:hypothetical protein